MQASNQQHIQLNLVNSKSSGLEVLFRIISSSILRGGGGRRKNVYPKVLLSGFLCPRHIASPLYVHPYVPSQPYRFLGFIF